MGRAVHQVLATLGYGDAIGNEVLGIQRVLRRAGYVSDIFVETADPRLEFLTVDYHELRAASHPDNLLIHHFSIGSHASRIAYALPDRMAFIYHNVTPPEFFLGVHDELVKLCYLGRRELRAYAARCDLAIGDSEFNRAELEALGFNPTAVLPVVPDFEHLAVAGNPAQLSLFDDEWTNVLFVGRMIPNKRIEEVIRIFHAYKRWYNRRSRLLLVGDYSNFPRYMAMLHHFVATLGAADVHFLGHVSNEELTAYYDSADVFLCASEHEGFCVPIMEAFHVGVPVVAKAATAVPATMDGGGLLFDREDPGIVAGLVDAVVRDERLRSRVLRAQDAALARLKARDFSGLLLSLVERTLQAPRRPHPPVTESFWDDVRAAEIQMLPKRMRPAASIPRER